MGISNSYGNDLLGILMNEFEKKRDGFGLNLQLIMDECKTFFFAGNETTGLLLTWTIMLLASNLEWQEKLRNEVALVCNGATPSIDHLPKLRLVSNRIANYSSVSLILLYFRSKTRFYI